MLPRKRRLPGQFFFAGNDLHHTRAWDFTANVTEDDEDALSEEELRLLEECGKEWKENPESFMSIDDYMESRGIQ